MGLFERALSLRKEKKGLYHRLLEYRKKWEQEPHSLYLKAKKLREQLESSEDLTSSEIPEVSLPEYTIESKTPEEQNPELDEFTPPSEEIDPFEDWQKEAHEEIEKEQVTQKGTITEQIIEDESEVLTLPEEVHVASQKRIDYYLALFDINDEFQEIDDYEELLETIAFTIQEQLGTRSIVIFGLKTLLEVEWEKNENQFHFILDIGYEPISFSIPFYDPVIEQINKAEEILYVNQLNQFIEHKESVLLQQGKFLQDFSLCFALKEKEKIYAIFFLSSPLEQTDYILDDLEFLRILIKLSITKLKQIKKHLELQKELLKIREFSSYSREIFKFIVEASSKKRMDDIYDLLQSFLEKEFEISMFSLITLVPQENFYKLFSGKNISLDSIQKFHLDVNSDLIGLISNLTTMHELNDFKNNPDIVSNFSEEDLSLMEHFLIIPLIHLNWLIGFIAIHKYKKEPGKEEKEILLYFSTLLAPILTNLIISEERETLFRDVFNPLKKRLELEFKKSEETQSPFSLIDLRIKNLKRLLSVNSIISIDKFLKVLMESINGTLYQRDYLTRLGQGRFIILLAGRGKEESHIYVKKLISKLKESNLFQESPIQPTYNYDIYSYPRDAQNLKKMLALIDN